MQKFLSILFLTFFCWQLAGCNAAGNEAIDSLNFFEDFENDLSYWIVNNPEKIRIVDSKDPEHGKVLEMHPGGSNTFVLLRESKEMTNLQVEGDVLFPEYSDNYLGVIYNYKVTGTRADYGCVYIKGNSSYVRVNPHRDGNVSRVLYDEYMEVLTGQDTIATGKWQHFKMEVSGSVCHFYVGNMETPKITFNYHEFESGMIGFEPRVIGSEVWIDNIDVKEIDQLSYSGPSQPEIEYQPEELMTQWRAVGPFRDTIAAIEVEGYKEDFTLSMHNTAYNWIDFEADGRGCIPGGRIIEWASLKRYAYFYSEFNANKGEATLKVSATNELKVWVNGDLVGTIKPQRRAWFDFYYNPNHAGEEISLNLKEGINSILIREKGQGWTGYSGDGFFIKLEQP